MIEGISFDGGGYLCIMYIGALFYLNKYSKDFDIKKIKMIHGSSAGSIIACCLALEIDPQTMLKESLTIDVKTLIFEEFNRKENLLEYFITEKSFEGMSPGNKFLNYLSSMLSRNCSFWHDEMTFYELYKKTGKKLIISSTNITKRESRDFCYKSEPDLPILLAIRMSCGIPIIFTPFVYKDDEYVDGDLYEKDFNTISNFLPNKNIYRFVSQKKTKDNENKTNDSKGIFGLISRVVFAHKPRMLNEKNLFVKKYIFESDLFFLNFNIQKLTSLYLEGIVQSREQCQSFKSTMPLKLKN
jgi:hypothetical protein